MFNSIPATSYASTALHAGNQYLQRSHPVTSHLATNAMVPAPFVDWTRPFVPRKQLSPAMKKVWLEMQLENCNRTKPLNMEQLIRLIRSDPAHPLYDVGATSLRRRSLKKNPDYAHLNDKLHGARYSRKLDAAQAQLIDDLFRESGGVRSGAEYCRTIFQDPRFASLHGVNEAAINYRLKTFRDYARFASHAQPQPQPQPLPQAQCGSNAVIASSSATTAVVASSPATNPSALSDEFEAFLTRPFTPPPLPSVQHETSWDWLTGVDLTQFDDAFDPAFL